MLGPLPSCFAHSAILTLPSMRWLRSTRRGVLFCRCIINDGKTRMRELLSTAWVTGKAKEGYLLLRPDFCSAFDTLFEGTTKNCIGFNQAPVHFLVWLFYFAKDRQVTNYDNQNCHLRFSIHNLPETRKSALIHEEMLGYISCISLVCTLQLWFSISIFTDSLG